MGEVSAVRSLSLYHAVASTADPADCPVAILLRPASTAVSIGCDRNPVEEVGLELCATRQMALLRRMLPGPARWVQPSQLLVAVVVPGGRSAEVGEAGVAAITEACRALGVPATRAAGGLLEVAGATPSRSLGTVDVGSIERSICLLAELAIDPAPDPGNRFLTTDSPEPSCLSAELGQQPESAVVAEALVRALEASLEFVFIPSMPTPAEMDAIYDWDERLVIDAELALEPKSPPAERLVS